MLDTKRSRGWVIAAVVAAWLGFGAYAAYAGDRAMDEQRADLVAGAEERLGDIDADEAVELVADETIDTGVGEPSELTGLLVIDGHEPRVVTYLRDGFEARYELEAWGRSESVIVRVDGDGLVVDSE